MIAVDVGFKQHPPAATPAGQIWLVGAMQLVNNRVMGSLELMPHSITDPICSDPAEVRVGYEPDLGEMFEAEL